ncbi:MAG: hypothetical protein DCC49_11530 [Acidobacteria bacterium]|nr:MAG: hypothetical protein DCC49_11530 [Acidobacteriota bacterium]
MTLNSIRLAVRQALLCLCLCVGLGFAPWVAPAHASVGRAVVIVDTGSQVRRIVVSFEGESISGLEALSLAGANPETLTYGGTGAAVCRLFGVGHSVSPQACLGTPSDQRYWGYFRAPSGSSSFRYSGAGAGVTRVANGDVEGWRFGLGEAPLYSSFCEVAGCGGGSSVSSSSGSGGSGGASGYGGGGSGGNAASSSGGSVEGGASTASAPDGGGSAGASDGGQVSGDPGVTGAGGAGGGPEARAPASGQLTDTRYAAGPGGDQGGAPPAQGPDWSEAGSRGRPFPYSLAALAVVLAGLGTGIVLARRKHAAIGR